jgi:phosphate transport system ATP-binding protein
MPSKMEIKDLEASYSTNSNRILKGISMTMLPGKVTALIGPSGCGKTTLLRCLNRLSEMTKGCQTRGDIYLDDQEIHDMDPTILRRKIGMVFQKPNPFPMSIRENILYGIKAAKIKVDEKELIATCLAKAAIWDELKNRQQENAFSLSIGQQQRVCIARSLATSPEVLLMDEPAASLDPSSSAKVEASIMAMRGEYTVVIVTHNMQQARRISDFTAFMYLGELVEYGETEQVFENPRREETRDYINGRFG